MKGMSQGLLRKKKHEPNVTSYLSTERPQQVDGIQPRHTSGRTEDFMSESLTKFKGVCFGYAYHK